MQPFVPGAAVPGAPTGARVSVQNSATVPHWPQISQQALRGQGFSSPRAVEMEGVVVPGTAGPHTALGSGDGSGEKPLLKQIVCPSWRSLQPIHPQVCELKASI